ncbi:hypothetical protein ACLOJK_007994 [Asimina triloba]
MSCHQLDDKNLCHGTSDLAAAWNFWETANNLQIVPSAPDPVSTSFRPTINEQTACLIVCLSENSSARNPSTPPAPSPALIVGISALLARLVVGIVSIRSASVDLKTHRHPILGPTTPVRRSVRTCLHPALASSHRLSSTANAVVENPTICRLHQRAPGSSQQLICIVDVRLGRS